MASYSKSSQGYKEASAYFDQMQQGLNYVINNPKEFGIQITEQTKGQLELYAKLLSEGKYYEAGKVQGKILYHFSAVITGAGAVAKLATKAPKLASLWKSGIFRQSKNLEDLLADANRQLDIYIESFKGQRRPPATAIGAVDPKTGKIVTTTSGDIPKLIHPELQKAADDLGGLGVKTTCGNTLGRCAEFRAANELLLANPNLKLSDIKFTHAVRPRSPERVIPRCENCVNIFGTE